MDHPVQCKNVEKQRQFIKLQFTKEQNINIYSRMIVKWFRFSSLNNYLFAIVVWEESEVQRAEEERGADGSVPIHLPGNQRAGGSETAGSGIQHC